MHQLTPSLPATPESLFAAVRTAAGAQPLLTYYDDATGERAELSPVSMGNWIAKTHFLLTDELGLGVGDRALIALPPHWLSLVVHLGAWSAGLEVVSGGAAEVAFVSAESIALTDDAGEVFALALAPWGRGFTGDPPGGTTDYVSAVRPQADAWAGVRFAAGPSDPALDGRTRADLVTQARGRAAELGLAPGARVLLRTTAAESRLDLIDALTPLTVGGSLVLVRNADPHGDPVARQRRADQEHVTDEVPSSLPTPFE